MINVRIAPSGDFVFSGNKEKDPADVVDVVVDYTQYFKTDDITSITVTGTNLTIDSSAEADNIVTIFISGGTITDTFGDARRSTGQIVITTSSATRTLKRRIPIIITTK